MRCRDIQASERRIGARLFDRASRKVTLTEFPVSEPDLFSRATITA
ncbi:LysR family transcriptional regulator [Amycolatopsis coloradensis]|uniref:LysR family transcriptional regulator n=1 Tax=Amycolatopsis coloradensis TaxID=76021 RepID=A0ACD5BM37_9PSEU